MPITILTTIILSILFLVLSFRTSRHRKNVKISLGHGDDEELIRLTRAHANFAEYVPLVLIIIFLLELHRANHFVVVLTSVAIVLGRLLHAIAFLYPKTKMNIRVAGMALTYGSIIIGTLGLVFVLVR